MGRTPKVLHCKLPEADQKFPYMDYLSKIRAAIPPKPKGVESAQLLTSLQSRVLQLRNLLGARQVPVTSKLSRAGMLDSITSTLQALNRGELRWKRAHKGSNTTPSSVLRVLEESGLALPKNTQFSNYRVGSTTYTYIRIHASLSLVVSDTAKGVFVTTQRRERLPGTFYPGLHVTDAASAKKKIGLLLEGTQYVS